MPRQALLAFRRGTAAAWTAANPVLAAGELGWESNTNQAKIGDGVTAWNALGYFGGGGGVPSGPAGGALAGTYPNPDLAAALGGNGLAFAANVLSVNVDGTTIEIAADTLRLKDTAVSPGSYGDSVNVASFTVDAKGRLTAAANVSITGGGSVAAADGWVDDSAETWTYASGSGGGVATFTITGDFTTKYTVGTKIKVTQTTVKYFVVTAVAVAGGTTTVTIFAGSDYTLANAAINNRFHSYQVNPQGWPGWFTYNCSPTGFSGTPTQRSSRFNIEGRACHIYIDVFGNSNTTGFTVLAPVNCARSFESWAAQGTDSGLNPTAPFLAGFGAAPTTTITITKNWASQTFTNSGTKSAQFSATYEI